MSLRNTQSAQYQRLVEAIGNKLGRERGWQARAAEALGVSPSLIAQIMRGKMHAGDGPIRKASELLGVPNAFFVSRTAFVDDGWLAGIATAKVTRAPRDGRGNPGSSAAEEVRAIAETLIAADDGPGHGKLSRVARRLGINQSYLTKILNGERQSVGMETLVTARASVGRAGTTPREPADAAAQVLALLSSMPSTERTLLLRYAAERWPS